MRFLKRPLCFCALVFAIGVLAGKHAVNGWLVLAVFGAFVLCVLFFCGGRVRFLLPIFAALGFFLVQRQVKICESYAVFAGNDSVVYGFAENLGKTNKGLETVVVKVYNVKGGGRVSAVLPEGVSVLPGQALVLRGNLRTFDTQRNPGGYDARQYAFSRWRMLSMYVKSVEQGEVRVTLASLLEGQRLRCAEVFDKILPKSEAGIMKAIVLGQTDDISEEVRDSFSDAGIYHILAVSGLHVTVICGALTLLLGRFLSKRKTAVVSIGFLVIYCLFTGAGSAVTRAVIMCVCALFGGLIGRKGDFLTSVSFAALCILIYSPLRLFDYGFLYSFVVVYGFALCGQVKFDKKGGKLKRKVLDFVAPSVASFPLSAYFFYKIPLGGVLLNIIILPLVSTVVVGGILSIIAGLVYLPLGRAVALVPLIILRFYQFVCDVGLSLPYFTVSVARPHVLVVFGFFAVALTILFVKKRWAVFVVAVYIAFLVIMSNLPLKYTITMLDVGQGDCTVVEYGKTMLVFDSASGYVTENFVNFRGGASVAAAFATHTDSDHVRGIIEMVADRMVKIVYLPAPLAGVVGDALLDELLGAAAVANTPIEYLAAGDVLHFGEISVMCFSPHRDASGENNEISLVLKVTHGELDLLITGDMDFVAEERVLQDFGVQNVLQCEILKVAHHGSKYSTESEFLREVSPQVGIIGVGRGNVYGHPTDETLERLGNEGVAVFRTDLDGAIVIEKHGKEFGVSTVR